MGSYNIKHMLDNYKTMFGDMPKVYSSPMVTGDSPELDTSTELGPEDIKKYQSLVHCSGVSHLAALTLPVHS